MFSRKFILIEIYLAHLIQGCLINLYVQHSLFASLLPLLPFMFLSLFNTYNYINDLHVTLLATIHSLVLPIEIIFRAQFSLGCHFICQNSCLLVFFSCDQFTQSESGSVHDFCGLTLFYFATSLMYDFASISFCSSTYLIFYYLCIFLEIWRIMCLYDILFSSII